MSLSVSAQRTIIESLQSPHPGFGTITLHQDDSITRLLGPAYQPGTHKVTKLRGFRVQVYVGNNTKQARSDAYATAMKVKELFPDVPVYTFFQPPRWLCRVGDFRTIEEADAMMRQLKRSGQVKELSIVREQISINFD